MEEGLLARLLSGRSGAQLAEALRSQDKAARKEAKPAFRQVRFCSQLLVSYRVRAGRPRWRRSLRKRDSPRQGASLSSEAPSRALRCSSCLSEAVRDARAQIERSAAP